MSSTNKLELLQIWQSYGSSAERIHALRDVSVTIAPGESLAVLGQRSSGKTTLLNLIGLLESPSRGVIKYGAEELTNYSGEQRLAFRRENIGYFYSQLKPIPYLSVEENVAIGLRYRPSKNQHIENKINKILVEFDLAHKRNALPENLTLFARYQLSLATAMISEPAILIADEPGNELDSSHSDEIVHLLHAVQQKSKITLIYSTSSTKQAELATQTLRLKDGRIIMDSY
ncbi:putative ABC transport system ATP-binding protein/lipoprotein-releasing system ATP-binding protein [Arsukibacterium tuosuense]|uniref:Putative ABC transport system ATP-binding protein/lipoprotein-releasing system ATP-binding protein n=1 Tax=Arsukibacterium tuosuense TaxID=1323745 RepID=A0A285JH42_9GAMM|nr:ATP-binding cassette domain-containing protein [Arsukibacterium tuosuense]SNY58696.1 putative ABC transport system ATP-binding protein/lipoprotein-releasing system ATP-binding protein [Arsukibacterium tuosuense]